MTARNNKGYTQAEAVKIKITAARINKGYTQAEAANLLGISVATLVNYEKGYTSPKYSVALKMAEIYEIPFDMLDFTLPNCSAKTNKGA